MPAQKETQNASATGELLNAVAERQGDKPLRAFARELDLPHTTYIETISGERPVGLSFLEAVASRYPELDPLIGKHLRERRQNTAA